MILVEAFKRGNLDNKVGEDIIRVMDMWVTFHNKWVAALVADGVKRFPFSNDINLIAGSIQESVPSE
ncbi:hypothetical protein G4B88_013454 [Cannabis sativa]|uniref:Uncharacterized protein n=1 Tax=Cannabis sativa TaxID=3483 RepID=A0A7J6HMJ6_CANSA|nr:hypothetical protein G4B88_013454 [Cannabis sativa]